MGNDTDEERGAAARDTSCSPAGPRHRIFVGEEAAKDTKSSLGHPHGQRRGMVILLAGGNFVGRRQAGASSMRSAANDAIANIERFETRSFTAATFLKWVLNGVLARLHHRVKRRWSGWEKSGGSFQAPPAPFD